MSPTTAHSAARNSNTDGISTSFLITAPLNGFSNVFVLTGKSLPWGRDSPSPTSTPWPSASTCHQIHTFSKVNWGLRRTSTHAQSSAYSTWCCVTSVDALSLMYYGLSSLGCLSAALPPHPLRTKNPAFRLSKHSVCVSIRLIEHKAITVAMCGWVQNRLMLGRCMAPKQENSIDREACQTR